MARTSSTEVTSGSMSWTLRPTAARRTARNWGRKISGSSRQTRMERQPRNGLASVMVRKAVGNLSPPRSNERITTTPSRNASATREK